MSQPCALYRYAIPLCPALPLGRQSLFRREGLLLAVGHTDNTVSYGEAAPLPGFSQSSLSEVTTELLAYCRRGSTLRLPESQFAWQMACSKVTQAQTREPASTADQDSLLHYPLLHHEPLLQWRQWPDNHAQRPAVIKLKPGRLSPADAAQQVSQLLAIAPVRLRLDINQLWSARQAAAFLRRLSDSERRQIEYIEEPAADCEAFPALFGQFGVAYAHDETTRRPGYTFHPLPGLAALVLKPMLLGERFAPMVQQAHQAGCRVIISSCYESSAGLHYLNALAAELTPQEPPGTDTLAPFSHDLLIARRPGVPLLLPQQLECLWQSQTD